MFYLYVFLTVGSVSGTIVHFVTREPMPWWPDTAIMGAVFGVVAVLGMTRHRRTFGRTRGANGRGTSEGHSSELYSAMFSACAVGVFLLIAGLVGYDTNRHATFRAGMAWAEKPIAWEIAAGAGLLLIAAFLFHRLRRWVVVRGAAPRAGTKAAGSGRSVGAERGPHQRRLPRSGQE